MAAVQKESERRRYPRTVFTPEEGIHANFIVTRNPRQARVAQVMNLSLGGLGLVVARAQKNDITPGARLMVRDISVEHGESVNLSYLEMDVMWMLDHDFLDNVGFGCRFSDQKDKSIKLLMAFMRQQFPGRLK